jgi:spore germination cell wall hydrolase CwlJ-like protein
MVLARMLEYIQRKFNSIEIVQYLRYPKTGEKMLTTKKMLYHVARISAISVILSLFLSFKIVDPIKEYSFQTTAVQEVAVLQHVMKEEVNCLADNIYYEAGTESYEGKLAVAQVTLNRVNSDKYPKNVCGVVKQKDNGVCQFSWVCLKVSKTKDKYAWEESRLIAEKMLTQTTFHDKLAKTNALFYHADYVNPAWVNLKVISKIGKHIFYTTT